MQGVSGWWQSHKTQLNYGLGTELCLSQLLKVGPQCQGLPGMGTGLGWVFVRVDLEMAN